MNSIFEHLEHEWHDAGQHVSDWFRHHGDTITAGPPPATGATMSLKTLVDSIETRAREGEAAIGAILQEHLPQAATLANLIETNPIFTSVENALHVPAPALDGVVKLLDALAAAYPKPEGGTTPEVAPAAADVQQAS